MFESRDLYPPNIQGHHHFFRDVNTFYDSVLTTDMEFDEQDLQNLITLLDNDHVLFVLARQKIPELRQHQDRHPTLHPKLNMLLDGLRHRLKSSKPSAVDENCERLERKAHVSFGADAGIRIAMLQSPGSDSSHLDDLKVELRKLSRIPTTWIYHPASSAQSAASACPDDTQIHARDARESPGHRPSAIISTLSDPCESPSPTSEQLATDRPCTPPTANHLATQGTSEPVSPLAEEAARRAYPSLFERRS